MSDQKRGISRRSFIKGAALGTAGVASAGLLAGCGVKSGADEKTAPATAGKASFEIAPPPIPDKDIKNTRTADLIVVGAGTSGLSTALTAVEAGAKVIVIAKDSQVTGRGGSNFAFNSKLTKQLGISFDVGEAFERVLQFQSHNINEDLWWLWANRSGEAMDWLIDKCVAAGLKPVIQGWLKDPIIGEYPGTHQFLGGPNGNGTNSHCQIDVCNALVADGRKKGMDVRFSVKAEQLSRDSKGRVTAVIAKEKDGTYTKYVGKKAVVLATGDYGADKEMNAKYCPIVKDMVSLYPPSGSNSGDGHKMALWIGAAMQRNPSHAPMLFGMADFLSVSSSVWEKLDKSGKPFNAIDRIRSQGTSIFNLTVNKSGERFANENMVMAFQGLQMMQQEGQEVYGIFDSKYAWEKPPEPAYVGAPQPESEDLQKAIDILSEEGGLFFKANTIEEIAKHFGLPVDTYKATISRYNDFCKAGVDEDYRKPKELLFTVEKPPFYGCRQKPMFLIPVGGLRTNNNMQVLDAKDKVIPGLYAVGTLAGDFFANCYSTHFPGNNLGRCLTFGYLTGNYIAKEG